MVARESVESIQMWDYVAWFRRAIQSAEVAHDSKRLNQLYAFALELPYDQYCELNPFDL